ncbi:hypothetical protein [Streptomyces sp. NPDC047706]|uniref:hypothetical protein n=1 Tax=Streptomyces sp. NPDC047706 TaxID=3365486 RepID=UPI00371C71D7
MSDGTGTWSEALRGPWRVLCAVATVVVGPDAAIANALDQANAAPLRHAADQTQAYFPAGLEG